MDEDLLHYVWKYRKFNTSELFTSQNEQIILEEVGQHNQDSGPDFFNARLKIGNQLWAGNVEIHVKSSDWFVHGHEKDPAFDSVILHVVYEHDTEIYRKDNSVIPTLELRSHIPEELLEKYGHLFSQEQKWIYCEDHFGQVDNFNLHNWLERLYFERLQRKSIEIQDLLLKSKNDWEAVLFKMLAKYFGSNVNSDSFYSMASTFDFSILRKSRSTVVQLESLFFGQLGLLESNSSNAYHEHLVKEYAFLMQKFQLDNSHVIPVKFFRLRPSNFPTIRISQLAQLYWQKHQLFADLMSLDSLESFYNYFDVSVSEFWKSHYTFQKESKFTQKKLTRTFVDLLVINVIIPLKFAHSVSLGKSIDLEIIDLISQITSESNHIVEGFNSLKPIAKTAMQSQALIELKTKYCDQKKCLKCSVGASILFK